MAEDREQLRQLADVHARRHAEFVAQRRPEEPAARHISVSSSESSSSDEEDERDSVVEFGDNARADADRFGYFRREPETLGKKKKSCLSLLYFLKPKNSLKHCEYSKKS